MPTTAELTLQQLVDRGERPFPSQPVVARYFPAGAIEDARRRLTRAIERGDGPGLVIGGAGMGKSLLLQVLAAHFQERFDIVLLGCARVCTRRALLQAMLFELGLPFSLRDEGQLRFTLLDHLLASKQHPAELLLLVDEAQSLSVTLLDELRMLTNLVHGGMPRIRLVLAGSLALEEMFASPELESLSQRLAARCYLTAFSRDETAQFMWAQLAASRVAVDDVLRPEAWEAVFEATDGVPRLVNQLCDRAITVAVAQNCSRIDRRVVQEAWADLQQLPSPWQATAEAPPAASTAIEFGGLTEESAPRVSPLVAELDVPIEPAAAQATSPRFSTEPLVQRAPTVLADPPDPFSEAYDEEEVVIDSFASFDLQHIDVPRVANRRDPKFATLVKAAMDESVNAEDLRQPITESPETEARPTSPRPPETEHDLDEPYEFGEFKVTEIRAPDMDHAADESGFHWPPIRLAFPETTESDALPPSSNFSDRLESQPDVSRDEMFAEAPNVFDYSSHDRFGADEPPVLVVEEDQPTECRGPTPASRPPQVRRQEYRRLFSRLRSG